jgi:hypothetical protein
MRQQWNFLRRSAQRFAGRQLYGYFHVGEVPGKAAASRREAGMSPEEIKAGLAEVISGNVTTRFAFLVEQVLKGTDLEPCYAPQLIRAARGSPKAN